MLPFGTESADGFSIRVEIGMTLSTTDREESANGCSTLRRTVDFEPAAMLFQHAVNRGETHASAFAGIFRCEEWLKNPGNRRFIHSIAGIFHRQADVRTELRFGIAAPRRFIDFHAHSH